MFTFSATFTRLSLTLFYYRLVKDSGLHWFRVIIHIFNAFSIVVAVALIIVTFVQCQ